MVSTASRVGTGKIIGVATAICLGGPGAIFWMWLTAFIGGATAFIESTLAQIYKKRDKDGSSYGGPAFYMQTALKQRWLGVIFSFSDHPDLRCRIQYAGCLQPAVQHLQRSASTMQA